MSGFFTRNKRKVSILILILMFSMIMAGCQGYKNEIEELEVVNEELKLEKEELHNELNDIKEEFEEYKELMEPYEELHFAKLDAVKEVEGLKFVEDKSQLIEEIENISNIDALNKKMNEIRKLEKDTKDEYIAELNDEIQGLPHLSKDKKKELSEELSERSNKASMDKLVKDAKEENQKIAKEKEEALKKEQEAKKKAASQSTGNSSRSTGSSGGGTGGSGGGGRSNVGTVKTGQAQAGQVYVTPTGSKYHSRPCGRGTYSPTSLSNAKAMGLTPCKRCYR